MQSYYIPAKIRCISGHQPAGQAAGKEQTYQQSAHQEGGHGHTHVRTTEGVPSGSRAAKRSYPICTKTKWQR